MEKESFEDEKVAAIMNEHFINVKVDREERPDVDQVYMNFVTVSSFLHGHMLILNFVLVNLKFNSKFKYFSIALVIYMKVGILVLASIYLLTCFRACLVQGVGP